jgi:hypothetical protein
VFAHRLARDLGKTLAEVLRMSPREWRSWVEFYQWEREQEGATVRAAGHQHEAQQFARDAMRHGR